MISELQRLRDKFNTEPSPIQVSAEAKGHTTVVDPTQDVDYFIAKFKALRQAKAFDLSSHLPDFNEFLALENLFWRRWGKHVYWVANRDTWLGDYTLKNGRAVDNILLGLALIKAGL